MRDPVKALEDVVKDTLRMEFERRLFESQLAGQEVPGMGVSVCVANAPPGSLDRVRQVWSLIVDADQQHWPSESEWMERLPEWFVAAFADPEVASREDAWDFQSWLFALEDRPWVWWSSQITDGGWMIKVCLPEWPYSVGALEWLAQVASHFSQVEVVENEGVPVFVTGRKHGDQAGGESNVSQL